MTMASTSINTKLGTVSGSLNADGTSTFLGVPFALPPTGNRRFKPPVPVTSYPAPINATSFKSSPLQASWGITAGPPLSDFSEDCLYLNIWRPAGDGPFPVLFYIYGGANIGGSTAKPEVGGEHFARNGVLCVTAAYRVGAAGFLELGKLLGAEYAESGNNGIRDLLCALEWTHTHINSFSGDAAHITLAGTSAGGKNICAMLAASPGIVNFVDKVLLNSGGWFINTLSTSEEVAELFYRQSGLSDPKKLLTISSEELLHIQALLIATIPAGPFCFRSIYGERLIPSSIYEIIATGALKHIHFLITTCRDENALFLIFAGLGQSTAPCPSQLLHNMSAPEYAAIEQHYEKLYPDLTHFQRRSKSLTAVEYWIPSVRIAEALANQKQKLVEKVHMIRTDRGMTEGPMEGLSVHGSDVQFYFNHPGTERSEDVEFANMMHKVWCDFVQTGECNWCEYGQERRTKVLDSNGKSHDLFDPLKEEREIFGNWAPGLNGSRDSVKGSHI